MHEFKRRFPAPPSDWSRPRLADVAERVTTRNVERNPNVLTISAEFGLISQSEFFSRRVASESVTGYFLLEHGDFAYNKSYSRGYPLGAIRRLNRYNKGCVSPLYICFRPRADAVNSDFLLHYLDGGAIDGGLAEVAKEGVRNHGLLNVGVADFFSLEVPLPPIAEQQVVAQVLDTMDTTIRQTEAIIEKLKQVKHGLLHDLLTRGIDANGELRPPQSLAPHLYKDSPLGWIPREWNVCGVLDLAPTDRQCILTGPFGAQLGQADFVAEGVPVLRIGNVQAGFIDWSDVQFVSRAKAGRLERFSVEPGDLLFARQGATTGRNALADQRAAGALINYHIIRVAVDRERCEPVYLHALFNSDQSKGQVDQEKGRGTREGINSKQIAALRFAMPHIEEQQALVARMNALGDAMARELNVVAKLRLAKFGLMDDLLTGRVRVTPLFDATSV
jgi:type I restriction enzyme, S subunit